MANVDQKEYALTHCHGIVRVHYYPSDIFLNNHARYYTFPWHCEHVSTWHCDYAIRYEEAYERKMFAIGSVELYANLCTRNKDAQAEIERWFPVELVASLIMVDRPGCDELRAAACELLFRLYVLFS